MEDDSDLDSDTGTVVQVYRSRHLSTGSGKDVIDAISHRYLPSGDSTASGFSRGRTSLSPSVGAVGIPLPPSSGNGRDGAAEIAETNDVLELYDRIFDEYLNGSDGDVNRDEWYTGLDRLGVELSHLEKTHLWNVLNHDDVDSLSRDQWSQFMAMKWDSEELQVLQAAIESRISEIYTKHAFREGDDSLFRDTAAATLMKRQMTRAIVSQAQEAQREFQREEEWLEDLHRRGADPSFSVDTNALSWDVLEVAYWLERLGMYMYMKSFKTRLIDGSILLRDIDENALFELGVEKFHMNKLLREIDSLRLVCGLFYEVQHTVYSCDIASDYTLRDNYRELQSELERVRLEYEAKLSEVNEVRINLQKEVNQLQVELSRQSARISEDNRRGAEFSAGLGVPGTLRRGMTDEFWEELDGEAERTDQPYADIEQSLSWSPRQVVFWLKSINCAVYAASFLENDIDGQILVQDMTREILVNDLNVRTLHLAKLQREIHKLRTANHLNDWEICVCDHVGLDGDERREKVDALQTRLVELNQVNDELNRLVVTHEAQISSLKMKIEEQSNTMSKALERQRREETSGRRQHKFADRTMGGVGIFENEQKNSVEIDQYRGISPGPPLSDSMLIGYSQTPGRDSAWQGIHDPKTLHAIIRQSRGLIDKQSMIIQKQLNTLKSQRRTIEIQQETMIQQEELIARQKMKLHKYDKKLERRRQRHSNSSSSRRDHMQGPGASMGSSASLLSDASSVSNTLNQLISRGLGMFSGDDSNQTTRR